MNDALACCPGRAVHLNDSLILSDNPVEKTRGRRQGAITMQRVSREYTDITSSCLHLDPLLHVDPHSKVSLHSTATSLSQYLKAAVNTDRVSGIKPIT